MKNSRFRYSYRSSASKLHKAVGEVLRNSSLFGDFEIYQEYPVNRINTNYPNSRHHFDWVIPKLNIVIEAHGAQHFQVVRFGGTEEDAEKAFLDGQARDLAKKRAALEAGYFYIMIPHYDIKSLDAEYIYKLIELAKNQESEYTEKAYEKNKRQNFLERLKEDCKQKQKEDRATYLQSDKHKEQLKKASEYRKANYRKWKEKIKND